jgi:hypothetical protein
MIYVNQCRFIHYGISVGEGRVVRTYDLVNFCLNSYIFQLLNITYEWDIFSLNLTGLILPSKIRFKNCVKMTHTARRRPSNQYVSIKSL